MALAGEDGCNQYPCIETGPKSAPLWAVVMGGFGAGVGAITGAFIKTDRWKEVPLDRVRVSIAPKRDGVAFGVRVVF